MRLIRTRRLADLEAAELTVPVLRRELAKQAEKHDGELAQLGRQLAERDDTIAGLREELRTAAEDSKKDAASNASRRMVVVEAFRADIRALKDDKRRLERALADHADRLAEVTAASQDKDIPVGSVDLVKREPA